MRYIPEFDGLRGFLSALVVIAHLQQAWMIWVWGGMDIFFTMSGFLIGSILLRNQSRTGFLKTYALRRILKIWPSYFATVVFCIAAMYVLRPVLQDAVAWSPGLGTWQYLVFLQNVELWFVVGRPDVPSQGYLVSLGHTWSVALEEQFYLLAPLICAVMMWVRQALPFVLLLFVATAAGGMWLRLMGPNSWVTLPARFDGFAAGLCLAAILNASRGVVTPRLRKIAWLLLVLGSAGIAWLYVHKADTVIQEPHKPLFGIGVTLFALTGAAMLALISAHQGSRWLYLLRVRGLVFLGRMSYSTYLWHIPMIWCSGIFLARIDWLSAGEKFWLQLSLVYLVAFAAYVWIESPLLKHRENRSSTVLET